LRSVVEPSIMVRWVVIVACGTPRAVSMSVSFLGVRATFLVVSIPDDL
jgi:hypothetical protein